MTRISTHDLTRRSTNSVLLPDLFQCISTHDLTRRSTFLLQFRHIRFSHFNSRPHEEVDVGGIVECQTSISFQLTTSRGGRPIFSGTTAKQAEYFNSRPHEEVDQKTADSAHLLATFQLTTSRGGRLKCSMHETSFRYFNSRPHEEVDVVLRGDFLGKSSISTHDLTRRSTCYRQSAVFDSFKFQLTTSRGGRPF